MKNEIIKNIAKVLDNCCNFIGKNGEHLGNKCGSCEYWCDTNNLCCSYNHKEATALYDANYRECYKIEAVFSEDEKFSIFVAKEDVNTCNRIFSYIQETTAVFVAKDIINMIDKIPTKDVNELNHLRLLKINIAKQVGIEVEV